MQTSAPSIGISQRNISSMIPYGRRRQERGPLPEHQTDVERMQPVDVLLGTDRALDLELAQVARERQLDDDPVDVRVAVQAPDRGEELVLGHVGRQVDLFADRIPTSAHALCFWPDVDARGLVVAHEDGGQARRDAALGERAYPLAHLAADLRGDGLAVEDPRGHGGDTTRAQTSFENVSHASGLPTCRPVRTRSRAARPFRA